MFSFLKPSPEKMRKLQLHDAQCSLVQHKQSSAYHQAMSLYLQGEIDRLSSEVAAEPIDGFTPAQLAELDELDAIGRLDRLDQLIKGVAVQRVNSSSKVSL